MNTINSLLAVVVRLQKVSKGLAHNFEYWIGIAAFTVFCELMAEHNFSTLFNNKRLYREQTVMAWQSYVVSLQKIYKSVI